MLKELKTKTKEGGKIIVNIRLDDECRNGHFDFAITGDEYNERGRRISGGCMHDKILEYFPELQQIVDLHLSDINGVPMYAIENGMYHIKENLQTGLDYLRLKYCTKEQKELLQAIAELGDKNMFYTVLEKIGAIASRKKQAQEVIEMLGFQDVYQDERAIGRKMEYTIVSVGNIDEIKKLTELKKKEELQKIKDSEIANHKKKIESEKRSHKIKMAMLNITTNNNRIYYNHSNTIELNRKNFGDSFPIDKVNEVEKLSKELGFNM